MFVSSAAAGARNTARFRLTALPKYQPQRSSQKSPAVAMSFEEQFGVSSVLLVLLIGTVTYIWWNRRQGPIKNVPCEAGLPFVGSYLKMFFGEPFFKLEEKWYQKYGSLFCAYGPAFPKLFLTDPTRVTDVLVKDFQTFSDRLAFDSENEIMKYTLFSLRGEHWKRVRSIVSPSFTTNKLTSIFPEINECAELTVRNLKKFADSGQPADCKRIFEAFTLDALARAVHGIKLESAQKEDSIYTQNARDILSQHFSFRVLLALCIPKLAKFLKVDILDTKAINFFVDLSKHCVQKKKESTERREDLLQCMMDKLEDRGVSSSELNDGESKDEIGEDDCEYQNQKKTITEPELLSQATLFFVVGFDTTSSTLAMSVYYLAQNPDCQNRLIQEVDAVWKKMKEEGKDKLDYESSKELKYMDRVISETLRRVPPGGNLERVASEDYRLLETDVTIPQGTAISVPVYALHHDPQFFPEPQRFDPDRFLPENKDKMVPNTYFPFGAGPRNCVGRRLALFVMKICLFRVFRFVSFDVYPGKSKVEFNQGLGFVQPRNVVLKIVKRNQAEEP